MNNLLTWLKWLKYDTNAILQLKYTTCHKQLKDEAIIRSPVYNPLQYD